MFIRMMVYQKARYMLCVLLMFWGFLAGFDVSTASEQDPLELKPVNEQIDLDLSGEWLREDFTALDLDDSGNFRKSYAIVCLTKIKTNSYTTSVRFNPPLSSTYYKFDEDPEGSAKLSFPGNSFKILEINDRNFKGTWIRTRAYIPGKKGGAFLKAKEFPFEGSISSDGKTLRIIQSSALNEGEPLEEEERIFHKVDKNK